MVSATNIVIGRDPAALKRISQEAGVHVVMGTGWYLREYYPAYVQEKLPDELAEILVHEIAHGVDGTDVRPGVIGEVGTGRGFIRPDEERVFRAVARAQRQTGVAISTHTTHFGELAHEQLSIFEEEHVDPTRVIIGHLGDRRGVETLLPIAERGVWLQIDNIGWLSYTSDEQRVRNLCDLADAGYLDRLLLGTDICLNSSLTYYGGRGYGYLLTTFVPLLGEAGFSEAEIRMMLVDNPARALSFAPHV
jgi:phosphotriesterase-related protein